MLDPTLARANSCPSGSENEMTLMAVLAAIEFEFADMTGQQPLKMGCKHKKLRLQANNRHKWFAAMIVVMFIWGRTQEAWRWIGISIA